jgi:hypothetical protein
MTSVSSPRAWARALALAVLSAGSFSCGGGGGSGGGALNPAFDLASVTPSPRAAAVEGRPGSFAADYLRATHFTRLVVEVDHAAGRPPTPAALELLRDRLAERCDKPDGVVVVADDAIPESEMRPVVSTEFAREVEDAWRGTFSDAATKTAAMYVLYLTGRSELDEDGGQVLGIAHRGGSVVFFVERAERGDDVFVTTAEIEGTGLVHEAGHLLGLVGSGVPQTTYHQDPNSFFHDADPSSVMFAIVHVPATGPNIGDSDFAQFNRACVDDLEAFGGLGAVPGLESLGVRPLSRPSASVAVGVCPCGSRGGAKRAR